MLIGLGLVLTIGGKQSFSQGGVHTFYGILGILVLFIASGLLIGFGLVPTISGKQPFSQNGVQTFYGFLDTAGSWASSSSRSSSSASSATGPSTLGAVSVLASGSLQLFNGIKFL
eukprot:9645871-Alexandrium_andersonii.AAC.1